MRRAGRTLLLGAVVVASPLLADDPFRPGCRAVLHDEGVRRDDRALDVELAETRFSAAEEIYLLVEKLWKQENIERIIYLRARRDRDAARLEVDRAQQELARQTAYIDQLRLQCEALSGDEGSNGADAAYLRYLEADCELHATSKAIAEVDLAYTREVLANVLDLRENDVATRQDVIVAERDVDLARSRVEDATRRVAACREAIAKLRRTPPG